MNSDTGGLSSDERQRKTAADIARKKVLSAYKDEASASFSSSKTEPIQKFSQNFRQSQDYRINQSQDYQAGQSTQDYQTTEDYQTSQDYQQNQPQTNNGTYKYAPVQMNDDLKKYHSAWQSYYQKYYSDYYSKAAKEYIDKEKMKEERKLHDQKLDADKLDPEATDNKTISDTLRANIQKKANSRFKLKNRHKKLIPLIAGISVTLFILFLQYNRLVFAPIMAYVSPGNTTDEGITAVDPTVSTTVSDENKLIIPKLNVDVPVHFGISNDSSTVNKAMMNGVAHFMIPGANAYPGQIGNVVITGHSAGDIYSSNQYKFIFSGLERLTAGDLVYIDYNKIRYTYKVTGNKTVEPTDVQSLVYDGDKAMLTLITCTPLGTSKYRLLVFAEQIDPAIESTTSSQEVNNEETDETTSSTEMPKNERSFFEKVWSFLSGDFS